MTDYPWYLQESKHSWKWQYKFEQFTRFFQRSRRSSFQDLFIVLEGDFISTVVGLSCYNADFVSADGSRRLDIIEK